MIKKYLSAMVVGGAVLMTGCESTWEKMTDEELAMKSAECQSVDPGPAMAQVCANVERECARRRGNKNYVC
jgi:hypothetical protein